MDQITDLRLRVVAALREREGELRNISKAVGIPYDTVLRIKNEEGDPGYSKVQALAVHLLVPTPAPPVTAAVVPAHGAAPAVVATSESAHG